jgi:hypothetical protein
VVELGTGGGNVRNCTITQNVAKYKIAHGKIGINDYSANCIIRDNFSFVDADTAIIHADTIVSEDDDTTIVKADTIIVEADTLIVEADTLIETDPYVSGFVGPDTLVAGYDSTYSNFTAKQFGNYRLTSASPYRNAGINANGPSSLFDIDGRPRIDSIVNVIDKGAYEC